MLKTILTCLVAAGSLAMTAPPASADDPTFGCGYRAVSQDDLTGWYVFEGVAYGHVAHQDGGQVTIRCYVKVNGVDVTTTPTGAGAAVAGTAGRISYQAYDTDVAQLCAEATTAHGTSTKCYSHPVFIPPYHDPIPGVLEFVYGLLDEIYRHVDPAVCQVLAAQAGDHGPVTINDQGDVFLAGDLWWDCPPYEIWPSA